MRIRHTLTRHLVLFLLLFFLTFIISFARAEFIALQYLNVLDIYNDETYQANKKSIYKITGDKEFDKANLSTVYPKIEYGVKSIKCVAVKGFSSYIFEVRLNLKDWKTIDCWVEVNEGVVIDAHRKNDSLY